MARPNDRYRFRCSRRWFRDGPAELAQKLLGRVLVRQLEGWILAGRIIETEAYLGKPDRAAHTYNGRRTDRNASMYMDGGTAYVYFTYGMHYCMNVVSQTVDQPTACLIRALEPLEGLDVMRRHRSGKVGIDRLRDTDLCSGPAKLCQALAIDRDLDGQDLATSERLWISGRRSAPKSRIITCKRIGVAYAGEWAEKPLRYLLADNAHVSVPAKRGS